MTTAEAIAQIREAAIRYEYDPVTLAAIDSLEAEIERLRAVVEAARAVAMEPLANPSLAAHELLDAALAALEEPVIPGYGSSIDNEPDESDKQLMEMDC